MHRSRIGLVIPALNEETTISKVVTSANIYGTPIVVDDGSIDETAKTAQDAGAVVVSHKKNLGYDSALNSGFRKADEIGCEIIISLDADGQHDPGLLNIFIDHIEAGADMVIGIRNKRQRLSEHVFAWYVNYRYGISDPLCGMKAYRTVFYRKQGYFDSYNSIGTELMFFGIRSGAKVEFVKVPISLRVSGNPRFGSILKSNYMILRAMFLSFWSRRK